LAWNAVPGLPANADERDLRFLYSARRCREPAYERAMINEVAQICKHIPHADLCIQWDVCHDMIVWDGQPQDQLPLVNASKADIVDRFRRICAAVPFDVELGFHLCYGDFGGKHLARMEIRALLTALAKRVKRFELTKTERILNNCCADSRNAKSRCISVRAKMPAVNSNCAIQNQNCPYDPHSRCHQ
jgi:methionine synthase II (cobalamin-independent)